MKPLFVRSVSALILLSGLFSCSGGGSSGSGSGSPVPRSSSFALGFAPIPKQPVNSEAFVDAFDTIKGNADLVLHHSHIDWGNAAGSGGPAPQYDSLVFVSGMAESRNLTLFLVIDPLLPDRSALDVPGGEASFSDALVREAFKTFTLRAVQASHPAFLALGSELNTYLSAHPTEVGSFLSLYRETATAVKSDPLNTNIPISITLQYEELTGRAAGSSQWELFSTLEPLLEFVSISTYPSPFFASPQTMPSDYYSAIATHTSKPVIIAESGWPSGGAPEFHGSIENQVAFIERVPALVQPLDFKLWVWWFLHDWQQGGYPEFFTTMGLISANGIPKPSLDAWRKMRRDLG